MSTLPGTIVPRSTGSEKTRTMEVSTGMEVSPFSGYEPKKSGASIPIPVLPEPTGGAGDTLGASLEHCMEKDTMQANKAVITIVFFFM